MRFATNNRERHYILMTFQDYLGKWLGPTCFEYGGQTYLLVTDFYSKYFEIELLRQNTTICVTNLKKIFARFGIPEKVASDNGLQYSNTKNVFSNNREFKKFAEEWLFSHTTSSPEDSQSNGAAGRAVQAAECVLKKAAAENKDPFGGLFKYRNTPFEDISVSPAQLLMSQHTQTNLFIDVSCYLSQWIVIMF